MSSMRRSIIRARGRWLNSPAGKKFIAEQTKRIQRERLRREADAQKRYEAEHTPMPTKEDMR